MAATINAKVCTRCNGTGKHSYNLKDADVCYGCGGTGKMIIAPKGQKKVKPTVDSTYKAVAGDILEIQCVLYRVEEIRWIAYRVVNPDSMLSRKEYNQQLKLTRLIDNETRFLKRGISNEDGMGTFVTPAEWVGKLVVGKRGVGEE